MGAKRRRVPFYAASEVESFDSTLEFTQPYYWLLHEALVNLTEYQFASIGRRPERRQGLRILDLGGGSGSEAMGLLNAFPKSRLVVIDFSAQMHGLLRRNFMQTLPSLRFEEHIEPVLEDMFDLSSSDLMSLASKNGGAGYDLVVSAFALHHYMAPDKGLLYRTICSVLRPGGIFLNGDLFSYQSGALARQADSFGAEWIRQQFTDPVDHLRPTFNALGPNAQYLRRKWLLHWKTKNIPIPAEEPHERDKATLMESETELLYAAGFSEVGCPFRYWQAGIMWALR